MALKYEINPPAPGVDVSRYQGNVDWPRVKAAGYAFAFVRLGYAAALWQTRILSAM